MSRFLLLILFLAFDGGPAIATEPSKCFGTTSNGRLENGWQLPSEGRNFSSYSILGQALGRTYVHSTVNDVVVEAYAATSEILPDTVFVYGETGFKEGGEFKPHKTHRNGLSVDFMVPIRDDDNRSIPLPTHALNMWGYDLEFDESGRLDGWTIDYEAIAEHVFQLHQAARHKGIEIWRVIFDPQLQPMLHESPRWPYLSANVQFSTIRSWVRHDDHYHVDFKLPCEPVA